jgi:hypothetical protein
MDNTLELLGLTQEQLQDRVIETVSDKMLTSIGWDHDGEDVSRKSNLRNRLDEMLKHRIDAALAAHFEKVIPPSFDKWIAEYKVQRTSQWGEKKSEPMTFLDYISSRVDGYLNEEVDSSGQSQEEAKAKGNSWYGGKQVRIIRMIDGRLTAAITEGIEKAFASTKGILAGGIEKAVLLHLGQFGETLKAYVSHVPKKD